MIKLHLGCNNKIIESKEWVNIDQRYLPGVTLGNVKYLKGYKNNSVDLIYASHLLEHFIRYETKNILKKWYEVLKPGGKLRLAVPNFETICEYYMKTKDLSILKSAIYGGCEFEGNFHYNIFDFNSLKKLLNEVGFINVKKYDYSKTEHSYIRDWARDYLPYHDKDGKELPDDEWEKGTLISLNVECIKLK